MLANDRDPVVRVHYDVHGATDVLAGRGGRGGRKKNS